jgi:flagellar basal-body rod modification protein FlgD
MTTGITLPSSSNSTGTANSAGQQLTGNFDTFLQLLTTQLQDQDPLNPMDSTEFTQQLVEYSQVEQQIDTNSNLQNLISLTQSNAGTAAVNYLNQNVTVTNGNAPLVQGSDTNWTYNLPSTPSSVTLTVTNSSGQTVYTETPNDATSGNNTFSWNGQESNGNTAPAGTYTLAVSATGSNGSAITPTVSYTGTVSEISFQNGAPVLMIGSMAVPLSQVSSITSP